MAWVAPDMSDRIFMDATLRVSNQGMFLGQFTVIAGEWVFVLDDAPRKFMEPNHNLHRRYSAPYVVKFVEKELALLKIADRLKS